MHRFTKQIICENNAAVNSFRENNIAINNFRGNNIAVKNFPRK